MFDQLDFVYMPSRDVAADVAYFTEVLGGRLVFAVDGMGTRVAMVALAEEPPRILLAGHLDGETPVLVYRFPRCSAFAVARPRAHQERTGFGAPLECEKRACAVAFLRVQTAELTGRGWAQGQTLEIPQGPVCSFTAPGGQRLAIYELTRAGVEASFVGRRDF